MESQVDICVIGAGPYGLSLAAYLNQSGLKTRIFGKAFASWRFQMPQDMPLKSAGFASSLADPASELTIDKFFADRGIPYVDDRFPVKVQDFIAYGMHFQERFVSNLEDKKVEKISRSKGGFIVTLADGERVVARKVVMAVGTLPFANLPEILSALPKKLVTHTSSHSTFEEFRGREVVVIGGGASALDTAASAHRAGASVKLFARRAIEFDSFPSEIRSKWLESVLRPRTGLGPGWRSAVMERAPWIFRLLPPDLRLKIVKRKLGPAGGCFVREMVEGRFPVYESTSLESAVEHNGRLRLVFKDGDGKRIQVEADHLIAGTGFRVDVRRTGILDSEIVNNIRILNGSPILSRHFESSVEGLYFCGLAAAVTFGPLLRFVAGTRFAASTISRHLKASLRRVASEPVAIPARPSTGNARLRPTESDL